MREAHPVVYGSTGLVYPRSYTQQAPVPSHDVYGAVSIDADSEAFLLPGFR